MITYIDNSDGIGPHQLRGFFVGWPNPPSPETHLKILRQSDHLVLAVDTDTGNVAGFVNAISDNVLAAYIPLLEVLPTYQKQGIGLELMKRILAKLKHLYMIDLMCDTNLQAYYAKLGLRPASGMSIRNFDSQAGEGE